MRQLDDTERDLVRYLHSMGGLLTCMQLNSGQYCKRTKTLCGRPLTAHDVAFIMALNDNFERVMAVAECVRRAGLEKSLETTGDVEGEYFRLIDLFLLQM